MKKIVKKFYKKIIKTLQLMEDLEMLQEFYTLFNFSFIMIYMIYKTLLLLKNQLL